MPNNYLKLAENGQSNNTVPVYFFVPGTDGTDGVYIREDSVDNLSPHLWGQFMDEIAPYQPENYLGENFLRENYLSSKATREARKEARVQKKESKNEARVARADAKAAGGGGGTFDKILGGLGSVAGGLLGIPKTSQTEVQTSGFNANDILAGINKATAPAAPPVKEKPFYKNPVVIGLGLLAAAGLVFVSTKKLRAKKRRGAK
jgi:hypothetical protein